MGIGSALTAAALLLATSGLIKAEQQKGGKPNIILIRTYRLLLDAMQSCY